jgi:hypothetical protein
MTGTPGFLLTRWAGAAVEPCEHPAGDEVSVRPAAVAQDVAGRALGWSERGQVNERTGQSLR